MLQYNCFYCIFDQINTLVSIFLGEASFKNNNKKKITDPKPLNDIVRRTQKATFCRMTQNY